jgi:alkaline phosphatase D
VHLPDGFDASRAQDGSKEVAFTLADYRTLYKTYRSDANLKEVHRLYPFIIIWDDHEFSDDCWQDHSTYFNELDPRTNTFTDEKNTPRRNAADQAFFEFQPVDVPFHPTAGFPNDIRIYRQLNWGKHADLFMTDERYYRSDHVVPEGPVNLAVGKPLANTSYGSRYIVRKDGFDPLEASVRPTMLGAEQKAWVVSAISTSTATWKVWGNEVQMYEMALDLSNFPLIPPPLNYRIYVDCDQWDGYRTERSEILAALQSANVDNLLVCTGDIHSFWAAELYADFAAPTPKPVGVEYVTAGLSSASLLAVLPTEFIANSPLSPFAGAITDNVDKALLATNPHLKFADANAYGFMMVRLDAAAALVTFVYVADPTNPTYTGVARRQQFQTLVGTNRINVL